MNQRRSTYFLLSGLESTGLFLLGWLALSLIRAGFAPLVTGIVAAQFLAYCVIGDHLEAYSKRHATRCNHPAGA
jgi:hypothetical protein